MNARKTRARTFAGIETLEGRLAPSALTPGLGPPKAAQYDHDHGHSGDRYDPGDDGSWEPRPLSKGSSKS